MRKLYFLVLVLFIFSGVKAQIVNIPDANFKAKLLEGSSSNTIAKNLSGNYFKIDANNDGEIQESEALQVSYLDVNSTSASSLQGIGKFTNLMIFYCYYNNLLTGIDFSGLYSLQKLICTENSQLTNLNLSGLNALQELYCTQNSLASLNLTDLNALKKVYCNSNPLTSLELIGLNTLESLSFGGSNLTSIDLTGLKALQNLEFSGDNQLTSINLIGLSNLNYLNFSYTKLTTLDLIGLNNLKSLKFEDNEQLTSLNLKGLDSLTKLECIRNVQLPNLNLSGLNSLTEIVCYNNSQLASLNLTGLLNLKDLNCAGNSLTSLNLSDLNSLLKLDCSRNQLTTLDLIGLNTIEIIECYGNKLTSLNFPILNSLYYIDCSFNKLTSLNLTGLTKLKYAYCSDNLLSILNVSGLNTLLGLYCNANQLTSLDLKGLNNIIMLYCSRNQLTTLDLTGFNDLEKLKCNDNELVSLFIKNGKINYYYDKNDFQISDGYSDYSQTNGSYDISNNPNLKYICADEPDLPAIQNKVTQYSYSNCQVNSYCSFVPGGEYYTINGNSKFDSNNNGCDVVDTNYPNLKFAITDDTNSGSLIANTVGNYDIPVIAGTHTVTPVLENPNYFTVSPTNTVATFPTQTSPFIQDFCVTANGIHPDLEVTVLPSTRARPGFDASYKIIYINKGTNTQSGSVNLAFEDAILDLVTANPVVNNQNTNTISWDFSDLRPFETREILVTVNINGPMETPTVNGGDKLDFTTSISSMLTDETPTDNTFTLNQTVVNAFDPNDKTCLEGATIPPSAVGKYVHYLIRFENKGTAEAQNVVVKDLIDTSKFDVSSLVVTQGSHPFVTKISETNKVEFIFENINLPFEDATNDGYVAFKIKTKPSLVVGDSFSNTASIYFDYNFPIVTNTATTSVLQSLGVNDFEFASYFKIYPNPAANVLNIDVKKQIMVSSISIYNTLGQQILVIPNAQHTKHVDVSNLKTGNYFIKLISDKGSTVGKFIKS